MKQNEILKIYGTDYKEMTKRLLAEADLIGHIPSRETMVGIKPNLVAPSPAEFGATTHPQVVAGIIEYLKDNGHEKMMMLEGSWVGDRTSESYEVCGYKTLSETYGVPFVDTQKDGSHLVDCDGMELNICDVVEKVDFLINVPVLKGHCQTKITCALKNMKGLIPNTEKRKFHTMGLHRPIAHLSRGIHQDFIVVDHICGDLDFEEGGNPVVRNCIMAAVDPVLVDSLVCRIIGYEVSEVPYIVMAKELGSGSTDIDHALIRTVGEGVGAVNGARDDGESLGVSGEGDSSGGEVCSGRDVCTGKDIHATRERKVLKVSYAVNEVDSCSACYASLVPALIRLEEEGLLLRLKERISIGQGHQGKGGAIGIGKCTRNHDFCIMGCPPDEETIYGGLKTYIEENES